jgi:hypothetical protein
VDPRPTWIIPLKEIKLSDLFGDRKDGLILKILAGGFSGIAGIIWGGGSRKKTTGKFGDGLP